MTVHPQALNRLRRLQPLLMAGVVSGFARIIWSALTADGIVLRSWLMRWQFWALEVQFVLFLAVTARMLPSFVRSLALTRSALYAPAGASLLALVLLTAAVPQTNRIFYDEHIYQGAAQNLADLRLAQMCTEGSLEYGQLQCMRSEYNKQPYGYPYLLSVLYRIGGARESIAHWFNVACAVFGVWVVFLTTCALWRDTRAGGFASLVAALIPQQLLWSRTAASEPSAALMVLVAVMTAVHFVRARTTGSLVWMVAATAFAVQFRPESILVVALVGLLVVVRAPDALRRWSSWWAVSLGAALCAAYLVHVSAVRGEAWGATGDRMALEYFWPNLRVNGMFIVDNGRFPVLFTVLAGCALVLRRTKPTLFVTTYFVAFWGVFLLFYAGSYDYGADVRFSLMGNPALAMLAGVGASSLTDRGERIGIEARQATLALIGALGFHFLSFMPQVRATGEEAWAARADVAFAHRVAESLPAHAIVLTHNPALFHLRGISAAQLSLIVQDAPYVTSVLQSRYAGGVFLHWSYWCNTQDPVQVAICQKAIDRKAMDPIHEYQEREYSFAFYRLPAADKPQLILKTLQESR